MNDIFSGIIILLGLWIAISTTVYLFKYKRLGLWWINIITIISSLYFSILFSVVILNIFPSGSPLSTLGRPGIILLLTGVLCNSLYSRLSKVK